MSGSTTTICQIFDKELDVFGTSPTIWHFRTRGSPAAAWRMVQDGVEWFGDFTPNVVVSVASTSPDIEPDLELCFDPEIKKYVPCP